MLHQTSEHPTAGKFMQQPNYIKLQTNQRKRDLKFADKHNSTVFRRLAYANSSGNHSINGGDMH